MPVMGKNDFKITSNPEGRYGGSFVGGTSGWTVKTVAKIVAGPGDMDVPKD